MQRFDTIKHQTSGGPDHLGFSKDEIWREIRVIKEWKIEIFQPEEYFMADDGLWTRRKAGWIPAPNYPTFRDKETALENCVRCFNIGQARIVGLTVHNKKLTDREEMDMDEFLTACIKYKKL